MANPLYLVERDAAFGIGSSDLYCVADEVEGTIRPASREEIQAILDED
ncbi:hypothetical protein [Gaiella occulta]|nr:hypothetical protein [Gaiella occulta]